MVKTIQARDISLYELEEKFGLQVFTQSSFFTESTENLLTLTDSEKQAIARVQRVSSTTKVRRSLCRCISIY